MIDADDLALLATSFEAAMAHEPEGGAADHALHELGWADLLDVAPLQGAATAFAALGRTGAAAGILDDVVAHALGLPVATSTCVALPAPHGHRPPGVQTATGVHLDGLVSARVDHVATVVVPVAADDGVIGAEIATAALRVAAHEALDPERPYRRVAGEVPAAEVSLVELAGSWDLAVRDARVALAHQLVAASRVMLEQARQHAVDRVQFGRAIASFQAVRHKLAESLVAIEAAAAVADACVEPCHLLTATTAKSLAGRAAKITATHAQQVLAGIGFTTDHHFHLSLKRTLVLDTLFGSSRTLPTEIGIALLAQRTAPRLVEL